MLESKMGVSGGEDASSTLPPLPLGLLLEWSEKLLETAKGGGGRGDAVGLLFDTDISGFLKDNELK